MALLALCSGALAGLSVHGTACLVPWCLCMPRSRVAMPLPLHAPCQRVGLRRAASCPAAVLTCVVGDGGLLVDKVPDLDTLQASAVCAVLCCAVVHSMLRPMLQGDAVMLGLPHLPGGARPQQAVWPGSCRAPSPARPAAAQVVSPRAQLAPSLCQGCPLLPPLALRLPLQSLRYLSYFQHMLLLPMWVLVVSAHWLPALPRLALASACGHCAAYVRCKQWHAWVDGVC